MSTYNDLMELSEGDTATVTIDDFENTNFPRDENPREINGEVVNVKEDVGHSGGEITRTVTIGNPWEDGCHIDCGDTTKNTMTTGTRPNYTYTKAWRPRAKKDRLLLGRVTTVGEGYRMTARVELVTDDYLELWLANEGGTGDITVSTLEVTV